MNKSTYATEHNRMFDELKYALSSNMAQLSVQANGGRSILFVYPPIDEDKYIASAKHILNDEQYQFIDLRQLLCQFIDTMGLGSFKEMYDEMGNEIFASTNFSEGTYFAFFNAENQRVNRQSQYTNSYSYRIAVRYGLFKYKYHGASLCIKSQKANHRFLSCNN